MNTDNNNEKNPNPDSELSSSLNIESVKLPFGGSNYEENKLPLNDLKANANPQCDEDISEETEKQLYFASLFLSGKPLDLSFFKKIFGPVNLENRLIAYSLDLNKADLGVRIRKVSGGFQMVTEPKLTPYLEKYFGERVDLLSKSAMEVASIVAYKQPLTKAEIERIRGVDSSGSLKALLDKNIVTVAGRKNVPGRPLLYTTTKYFLEYFGMNDLSELPTFREWQELRSKK